MSRNDLVDVYNWASRARSGLCVSQLCFFVQASPSVVTSEQRHAAELIFLNFRKTQAPYAISKHIFGKFYNFKNLFFFFLKLTSSSLFQQSLVLMAYITKYYISKPVNTICLPMRHLLNLPNTVEPRLSGLIGTDRNPDMRKSRY